VETSGAYGHLASAILKKMAELRDQHDRPDPGIVSARKHFIRQVSVIIAIFNDNMNYFARTHMRQDVPDHMEVFPQPNKLRYSPNMLKNIWPSVRLKGEEDDRIQAQGGDSARTRRRHLR
jgi:hypothetical protein